jgi:hypothetical protein
MKLRWVEAIDQKEYNNGFERLGSVYALQILVTENGNAYWETVKIEDRKEEEKG